MKEVLDFLKKCKTFYLATIDNDQPHVRPMGIAEEYEGKIYIQTGKVKNVFKQIDNNLKAEICAYDGQASWLRIECELIDDDRLEVKEFVLDNNPSLKGMYSADDDNTKVLYMKNATATFYSFTEAPRVVAF